MWGEDFDALLLMIQGGTAMKNVFVCCVRVCVITVVFGLYLLEDLIMGFIGLGVVDVHP